MSGSVHHPPPVGGWAAPASSGAWTPSGGWAPAEAAPVVAPGRARGTVLVLVGAAVGAAVAALVAVVVLLAGARELVVEVGAATGAGLVSALYEDGGVYGYEDAGAMDAYAMPEPEQFPAVEPGVLGPDPVLDAYAQGCFGGELQSCDDLYFEAPPLSDYEQYGGTCGGRVKLGSVYACTELD